MWLCHIYTADALKEAILPPASETEYNHFEESSFSSFGGRGQENSCRRQNTTSKSAKGEVDSYKLWVLSTNADFLNLQEYHLFFLKMTHTDRALAHQRLCLSGSYLPLGLHYSWRDGIGVKEAFCSLYQPACNQPLGFFLMNNDIYTVDTKNNRKQ